MPMISFEIFPKRVSIMASVRISKMHVFRVKIIMIFFQKLSWTNQVFSCENIDSYSQVSPIENYYYIVIMKADRMKIPPLSQLYEQKHDYEVHRKKLQKIMSDRKSQMFPEALKDANPKKNSSNYQRRYNSKSLEIARVNSNLVNKIQKVKPSICFRYPEAQKKTSDTRTSHSLNSRTKIMEQERQNSRIRSRVKSMNSSLNKENLLKDYNRSVQIKNRLVHFKTEQNNKVILKANRYLNKSSYLSNSKLSFQNKMLEKGSLPQVPEPRNVSKQIINAQKLNKELINMKLNRVASNIASYYKKDDILKNKVTSHNKLFKAARERRSQVMTTLQKQKELREASGCAEEEASNIFPTALAKATK